MPSGVCQVSWSRSPLTSLAASASQSDRVGRSLSPMRERVRRPSVRGEAGGSARLGELLCEGGLCEGGLLERGLFEGGLERSARLGHTGATHLARAGVEAPVTPGRCPTAGPGDRGPCPLAGLAAAATGPGLLGALGRSL